MSHLFPALLSLSTHKQNTSPHVVTAWYPTADFLVTKWLWKKTFCLEEMIQLFITENHHIWHVICSICPVRGTSLPACRHQLWQKLSACLAGLEVFKCSLVSVTFFPAEYFSPLILMGWHPADRDWSCRTNTHTHTFSPLLLIYHTQGYAS